MKTVIMNDYDDNVDVYENLRQQKAQDNVYNYDDDDDDDNNNWDGMMTIMSMIACGDTGWSFGWDSLLWGRWWGRCWHCWEHCWPGIL